MVRKCCVVGCDSKAKIKSFAIPRRLRNAWLKKVGREEFLSLQPHELAKYRICYKHFRPSMIKTHGVDNKMILNNNAEPVRLLPVAKAPKPTLPATMPHNAHNLGRYVQFNRNYFNSHPFTADRLYKAVLLAFGSDGHVPDTDNIAVSLSNDKLALFEEAWKAKSENRCFRRQVVSNFLNLHKGQPVSLVNPWRASTGWTFLYFLEKRFYDGDKNAKAIRQTLKNKGFIDAEKVKNFVRVVFECQVKGSDFTKLYRILRSQMFREEALFIIRSDKQAYFETFSKPKERSMKYFFKSLLGLPIRSVSEKVSETLSKPLISRPLKTPLRRNPRRTRKNHSKAFGNVEQENQNDMEVDEPLPQEENEDEEEIETSSTAGITSYQVPTTSQGSSTMIAVNDDSDSEQENQTDIEVDEPLPQEESEDEEGFETSSTEGITSDQVPTTSQSSSTMIAINYDSDVATENGDLQDNATNSDLLDEVRVITVVSPENLQLGFQSEECQVTDTVQVAEVCSSNKVPNNNPLKEIKMEVPANSAPESSPTGDARIQLSYTPKEMYEIVLVQKPNGCYWPGQVVEIHNRMGKMTWGVQVINDGTPLPRLISEVNKTQLLPYNVYTARNLMHEVTSPDKPPELWKILNKAFIECDKKVAAGRQPGHWQPE